MTNYNEGKYHKTTSAGKRGSPSHVVFNFASHIDLAVGVAFLDQLQSV